MIRIGIVGCNYGRTVLLPAFRADSRCEVVALAGTEPARTREFARVSNVARSAGDWRELVEDRNIDAIAIAVPPSRQPQIAGRALDLGKAVFVEKPLAADLAGARTLLESGHARGHPAMIDLGFPEITIWQRTREMLVVGAIGQLRHVVVTWNVENQATRLGLKSWKTSGDEGGGVLGNFVSHCFHYLEWFCGPVAELNARVLHLPGRDAEMGVAMALDFASGAGGSLQMSCASFPGSGHRIEFYGEDGALVLANAGADYMRGFSLHHASRSDPALRPVGGEDSCADASSDGRIATAARLVRRFIDACMGGGAASPGLAEGYRAQVLLDAARRAHTSGCFMRVSPSAAGKGLR